MEKCTASHMAAVEQVLRNKLDKEVKNHKNKISNQKKKKIAVSGNSPGMDLNYISKK